MNEKESYKIRSQVEKLKSSSSSQAYEALIALRGYIAKTKDGIKVLKENNVLKYLVHFLNKPNEKIIDMSLSILGNCCLDSACRNEAVNHGILSPLVSVLQNIAKDSIQGRACRLIGNLAQDYRIACKLHKEGVVTMLVAVLEANSKNSSPTRQMAIRALRMLWSVEQQRENMLDCRAVCAITQLLPLDIKEREDEDLVKGAIKALTVFTYQCSETCALQVIGDGKGFQDLVALVSQQSMKSSVLTCISNLCQIASCRHTLGVAGAVNIMIEEIAALDEGTNSKLMLALCLLCRDAFTRHKIVSAGGLPLMLATARSSTSTSMHPYIFQALMQFVFDEEGMQALIGAGLVEVLVQKLKEIVKQHGKAHNAFKASETASKRKNKNSKKRSASESTDLRESSFSREEQDGKECIQPKRRFRASSPNYQAVVQEQGKGHGFTSISHRREISPTSKRTSSPDHSPASSGYHSAGTSSSPEYYWDWSPGSPNNMCISSESHSPPRRTWSSSPTPSVEMMDESHTEDDVDFPEAYSPVCQEESESNSDMEEEEACLCIVNEPFQEEDSDDKQIAANENFQTTSSEIVSAAAESGPLLVLLSRVASLGKPVMELAATSTLRVLIDYITLITRQMHRAVQILLSIIRNPEYFLLLIQHEFVFMVQSQLCQHKHSDCGICDAFQAYGSSLLSALSSVAQTGFGEGALAHKLLKGDHSVQTLFAISIPFVIKNHKSLKFLLLECGGLDIIFTIFENNINKDYPPEYISTGLCLLAASLGIANPQKQNSNNIKDSFGQTESNKASGTLTSEISEDPEDSIILKLDDGTNISSSKAALSLLSPMFEAMFRGGFRESNEKCVSIPEISNPCLSQLLEMMKIGEESSNFSTTDLPTAMEMLAALNRFLIPGGDSLRKLILEKHLSPETAVYVYERSIEAGDNPLFHSLHSDALKYMLTADVSSKQKQLMFKRLQDSMHREKMIADIKAIFIQNLRRSFSREFSIS